MEDITAIEESSRQVDEMVQVIIGNNLDTIRAYITDVRNLYMSGQEILDDDLAKIALKIPTLLFDLIVFAQQIEMRKGVASEQAKYSLNEAQLRASGTVNDKKAMAENQTATDRIKELAYKTASAIVQKTIDGASAILDSTKKIQQTRLKEKQLGVMAGSSACTF